MRILITGVSGQLGHDVYEELEKRYGDVEILAPTHQKLDITNKELTINLIKEFNPDVIYHCAAYTAVDKAESDKETCYNVNVVGTKNITDGAASVNAKLFYISTDYVFDGEDYMPYVEQSKTNPVNFYGKTKLLGEQVVSEYAKSFIVRISWVFGINGKNFVKTMLRLAETKNEISVVTDQVGSPTYTRDLAKLLVDMAESNKYGVYHATNEGYTNWCEFAEYIFASNGIDMKVHPIYTSEYKQDAKRPLCTTMAKYNLDANGFDRLPDWHDAIDRYNKELKQEKEKVRRLV